MSLLFGIGWPDVLEHFALAEAGAYLCLCSPTGIVLNWEWHSVQDSVGLLHFPSYTIPLERLSLPAPLQSSSKFSDPLPLLKHVRERRNFKGGPESIDSFRTDATLHESAKEVGLENKHYSLPIFFERHGYTISMALFDYLQSRTKEEAAGRAEDTEKATGKPGEQSFAYPLYDLKENLLRWSSVESLFRPFDGWALCLPLAIAQEAWDSDIDWDAEDVEKIQGRGRPRSRRDKTLAAYLRLYPNGPGALSLFQVLEQVNRETGLGVSIDTLKRAISDAAEQA